MPSEPFLDSHREGIQILVHLFNKSNGLNNGFVLSVDVELNVVSWKSMGKTQFSFRNLEIFLFDEGREMGSNSSEKLEDNVIGGTLHL